MNIDMSHNIGKFTVMVLALMMLLSACSKSNAPITVAELLDLGEKYLLELNYEQALVQFLAVIEVEPMNPRGYTGAAEAYVGLDRGDKALAVLRQGLEHVDNDEIRQAVKTLETMGYSDLTVEQKQMAKRLMEALIGEDLTAAVSIVDGDDFRQLAAKFAQGSSTVLQDGDIALAIYPGGHVYCGETDNGLRSGPGIWLSGDSDANRYNYYKGQWADDLPNGEGVIISVIDDSDIEKQAGSTYAIYVEEEGTFKDGYYDGAFSVNWKMDSGEIHLWHPIYEYGIAQKLPGSREEDGHYDIAICVNCGANLMGDGNSVNYVFGFD